MIPADHITFDGDTAWLVFGDDDNERMFFPAAWVTDLDRPCDTCDGVGFVKQIYTGTVLLREPCPADCIDGRHTFEIEVERFTVFDASDGQRAIRYEPTTYRVSIVPGMVLPIKNRPNSATDADFPVVWITNEGHTLMVRAARDHAYIILPPAAAPGTWAVQLKGEVI